MENLSEILVKLANQTPAKRSRKRRAFKKIVEIKEAKFTSEQRDNVFRMALYGTNPKHADLWWRLYLLTSFPNIAFLAGRLGMSSRKLEREYKSYISEYEKGKK